MKEIILLCYVLCLIFLASALTCTALPGLGRKRKLNKTMLGFIIGLIVICFYDMGIYYWNYVIGNFSSMEIMRIGNCLIAGTMFFWIMAQKDMEDRTTLRLLDTFTSRYLLAYAGLWFLLTIILDVHVFYTIKWLLLATDIALILVFIAAATAHIIFASVDGEKNKFLFLIVVTALMLWNYVSYFWSETSVYWGNSDFIRAPMDLTIIVWLAISWITLMYVYRTEAKDLFRPDYEPDSPSDDQRAAPPLATLDKRIERICEKYKLTPREHEFVELIYKGKSNKDIAESLFLSESTVKTHIYNIFRKMEVKSRVEVIYKINEQDDNVEDDE